MPKPGPKARPPEEILRQIEANSIMEGECRIWLGNTTPGGYGQICFRAKQVYVHRFIYEFHNGVIPLGEVIRHKCDNPACSTVSHLTTGTHADNVSDKVSKRRHSFGEKHYRSKLSLEDVQAIRESSGTYAELGRAFNISRGAIHNIKSGRSWRISSLRQERSASFGWFTWINSKMADWRPGALSGHKDYEIHDELYSPEGHCVAVLECFTTNPTTYYCNAISPDGTRLRLGAGVNLDTTKDWAERVTGLKIDRPIKPKEN